MGAWGSCKSPLCKHLFCLKLVLLECSDSKSDCEFWFSMLKNLQMQIFEAIRTTRGVWQHIGIFAWWHVQVIFNPSTIIKYKRDKFYFPPFSRKLKQIFYVIMSYTYLINILWFLYPGTPEIAACNYACSICYIGCCLSKSHARVIKRKSQCAVKRHWLPWLLQIFAQEVFQHAESKFAIRFALWPSQHTSSIYHPQQPVWL